MLGRRDFLFFSSTAVAVMSAQVNGNQALAKEPKNGDKPTPEFTDQDRDYMRQAVQLMRQAGVVGKTGGPFGAVVVRDGKVLAESGNSVIRDNDPSAHAEVNAIRMALSRRR
jgi:guanine deaminase